MMSDEAPLLPRHSPATAPSVKMRGPCGRRNGRYGLAALVFLVSMFMLARQFTCSDPRHEHSSVEKVPLEAHIMSKCPDARDCLQDLILPVMQNVSDKVDFKLSYIGRVTDHDDGVECMHGQTECLGNILELCAASVYPDPKLYLGFTMCLSREYADIPQKGLIEDCALEHGMDFNKLNECMSRDDGAYAMGMLRDSVTRSKEAGVTKSCTVRLNEQIWCIRDGGEWKDCPHGSAPEDLVREIKELYRAATGWSF